MSGTSHKGALLIDKPAGPTSHDVVAFVRRTMNVDRAGHTGTLDPLATGLLIVLVGSATRLAQFVAADDKEYIAHVRLGVSTPTYDAASLGEAREAGRAATEVTEEEVGTVLKRFRGTFLQTPPPYSAKKIASVPAYEKARKQQSFELKPVEVTVRTLETITDMVTDTATDAKSDTDRGSVLRLRVAVTAGFYVRSLAHDIGQALGCGAHLEALRRTRAGRFRVDEAVTLDRVEAEGARRIVTPSDLLGHMPSITIGDDSIRRIVHGNAIQGQTPGPEPARHVRVLDGTGQLLAVAEPRPGGVLQPLVVLR